VLTRLPVAAKANPERFAKLPSDNFDIKRVCFSLKTATQKIETDSTSHPNPGKTEFGMRISPN
jgi:hypothetical protein